MSRPNVPLALLTFTLALIALLPAAGRSDDASIRGRVPRPTQLHVAWLDGRTLEQALAGGEILDRFPDAVLVSNDAALARLRAAGFRIEGPVVLPADGVVTLLRADGHASFDPDAAARAGARVLWHGGDDWLVASDDVLGEHGALLPHHRKVLRERPLGARAGVLPAPGVGAAPGTPVVNVTSFSPVVQQMVDQVSGAGMIQQIGQLAGKFPVTVGGVPTTFTTRSTPTTLCDKAEQYVFERFQAMGFASVAYDPYTFSSVSARNVVATKAGAEFPNRIVVIGGHLDSTSPIASTNAPGANDNASGVAGLLATADILRNYSFKNTIKFIAFTGEEQGLFGSEHYANAAASHGDSIIAVVIYDMIGWKNLNYKIDIEGESAWLPLMNVMNDACTQFTSLQTDLVLNSFGSDHVPFQDNNYPAFLAIEDEYDDYPCYHQTCDTTGWNQAAIQADVVRAGLATVAHMAVPRVLQLAHTPLENTGNTTGPYDVVATFTTSGAMIADSLLLRWSTGGAETAVVMTTTGAPNTWHALIPGQANGTTVSYWVHARDSQGLTAASPADAPASKHQFLVSTRATLFSDGFETGGPGWTSGGTANEWQIGPPGGLAEDPATAFAGANVAGTDLTGLGANPGRYEPFADSWFESPPVDCSQATDVQLTFMRKLATDKSGGGTWDAALVWVNGTLIWSNPPSTSLIDANWTSQTFNIGSIADGSPAVRVKFGMRSNATVQYGGWNIDDVKLTGFAPIVTAAGDDGVPHGALLYASVPNPGRAEATLRFELAAHGPVTLAVYDVGGRLVRTLVHGARDAGLHQVRWDGRDEEGRLATAGLYLTRLDAAGSSTSRKLVLTR